MMSPRRKTLCTIDDLKAALLAELDSEEVPDPAMIHQALETASPEARAEFLDQFFAFARREKILEKFRAFLGGQ